MATYQSPGVYIEEIAAGPRPIQASGTTSTGFVGVLELPSSFKCGFTSYNGFNPSADYADTMIPMSAGLFASWTVARAFFPLAWAALKKPLKDGMALPAAAATVLATANAANTAGDAWATLVTRKKALAALTVGTNATQDDKDRAQAEQDAAQTAWDTANATLTAAAADLGKLSATTVIPELPLTTDALKAVNQPRITAIQSAITAAQAAVTEPTKGLVATLTADVAASTESTVGAVVTARGLVDALSATGGAITAMTTALKDYKPPNPFATAANSLQNVTTMVLPSYSVTSPPENTTEIVLTNGTTNLVVERDAAFVNSTEDKATSTRTWVPSLATLDDPAGLVNSLAPEALKAGIVYDPSGLPGAGATNPRGVTLLPEDVEALRTTLATSAPMVSTMDGFHTWRQDLGRKLYVELLQRLTPTKVDARVANDKWKKLPDDAKAAWDSWIRNQNGMRLLEIGLSGFFSTGGTVAYMGVALTTEGLDIADKVGLLKKWFDAVSDTAILVAPGLNRDWQGAIMDYARLAAPAGRGDLFSILDTPRYFLSTPPDTIRLNSKNRWVSTFGLDASKQPVNNNSAFELPEPELLASPVVPSLRYNPNDTEMDACVPRDAWGYGAAYGPWLIVRNPVATGTHDAYVVAPPSGHVAGGYAYNDNTYGVQKVPANQPVGAIVDVVASVTATEQGPINVKGINLIRQRPGGILIWGGRTTSTDGLWRYINFRRVFLFVERSVRDAVQYAVFLPNNDQTRSDLSSTIAGFLYAQWQSGVLDGTSMKDAYFVQCDAKNNPIETRRNGYLNVDVGIQPPYPAEFVVIRFRQMA